MEEKGGEVAAVAPQLKLKLETRRWSWGCSWRCCWVAGFDCTYTCSSVLRCAPLSVCVRVCVCAHLYLDLSAFLALSIRQAILQFFAQVVPSPLLVIYNFFLGQSGACRNINWTRFTDTHTHTHTHLYLCWELLCCNMNSCATHKVHSSVDEDDDNGSSLWQPPHTPHSAVSFLYPPLFLLPLSFFCCAFFSLFSYISLELGECLWNCLFLCLDRAIVTVCLIATFCNIIAMAVAVAVASHVAV